MVVVVRMMRRIEQVLHLQVTLFALEAQLVEPLLSDEHLLVALLDGVELDESTQLHLLALASLILLALLLLESELLPSPNVRQSLHLSSSVVVVVVVTTIFAELTSTRSGGGG